MGAEATTTTTTAARLRAERMPFVHATVVRAEAPTSARAGDTALVHADGRLEGFVGGTCAESSVRLYSLQALANGQPLLLRILPDELPAGARPDDAAGTITVGNPCLSGGAIEVFLEPHSPAPRLFVVGETPIARSLAELGRPLGFKIELCAGEDVAPLSPGDADGGVVVASHGKGEIAALEAALDAGVPYVALVASRRRGASVLADLAVDDAARARVHTPAGLDLGARTAAEVALSILAEIVSLRVRPAAGELVVGRVGVGQADLDDPQHRHPVHRHVRGGQHRPPTVEPAAGTAIDPICGMAVAEVPASLHTPGPDGEVVYFCGEGCRSAYLAGP